MKRLLSFIVAAILLTFLLTPNIDTWSKKPFPTSRIIFSSDAKPLYWQGPPYRLYVRYSEIPSILIDAIRTTEDHRFFFHDGIDFIALVRAIKHLVKTGKKDVGASTITMQLARNAFLSPEKSYSRKIKELILAIKIDAILSKQQIMELYLNRIYFGNGAYGVAAAAWRYYGKKLSELTLAEYAMIAGLPQAPSINNPIAKPDKALARRNLVLRKLLRHKIINKAQYNIATAEIITAKLNKWPKNIKYRDLIRIHKILYLPPRKINDQN